MLAPASSPRAHADAFVELQKVTHTYGRGDKEVRALESVERAEHIGDVAGAGGIVRSVERLDESDVVVVDLDALAGELFG